MKPVSGGSIPSPESGDAEEMVTQPSDETEFYYDAYKRPTNGTVQ
jgi:hypothetical protein